MELELNLLSNSVLSVSCWPGAVLGLETHGEQNQTASGPPAHSQGPGTDGVTAHTQLQPGVWREKWPELRTVGLSKAPLRK